MSVNWDLLEGRESLSLLFTLLKMPGKIHCTHLKMNRRLLSLIGFIILKASVDEEYFVTFLRTLLYSAGFTERKVYISFVIILFKFLKWVNII